VSPVRIARVRWSFGLCDERNWVAASGCVAGGQQQAAVVYRPSVERRSGRFARYGRIADSHPVSHVDLRDGPDGSGTYAALRGQALDLAALGLPAPPDGTGLFAVVVDIPGERDGSGATVVAMADGTSSMYSSSQSVIGAGRYRPVRAANQALRTVVAKHRREFLESPGTELPPAGTVRIHAVHRQGRRVLDISSDQFWRPADPPPVLAAAQAFITALRETAPALAGSDRAGDAPAARHVSPAARRISRDLSVISQAFEFLVDDFAFVADRPAINPTWESIRATYRNAATFVTIDVCTLEQTTSVLVGSLEDGRVPAYPLTLPPTGQPLTWIPLWMLAHGSTDIEAGEPHRPLADWAALLREHAAAALAGDPTTVTLASEGRSCGPPAAASTAVTDRPALVIGQGQVNRVAAYAEANHASHINPPPAPDQKKLLETIAAATRGAIAQKVPIIDLGPDPYINSDGGWIYTLQRTLLHQAG
jgi:hypothetical protein